MMLPQIHQGRTRTVVMDPSPLPPVDIPGCRRVRRSVRTEGGSIKCLPVLECPASHRTYMFIKKLVHEKSRVMIMLAVVMREAEDQSGGGGSGPSVPAQRSASSGVVLQAYERVVIKVTDRNYIRNSTELIENPLDEISAMKLLSCPGHAHVLEVMDYMQDDEYLYLVMPYLRGKDLFQRLEARGKPLSERTARRIFRQMLEGLAYMKSSQHMAHRDLSLENVMFDDEGNVKIIDLGMCLKMPVEPDTDTRVLISKQARRGKPGYVCPQVAREEVFDGFAADVWSCGVILFIMLTLTPLYGHPEDNAWQLIVEGQIDVLLDHYESLGIRVSALARDLITGMMHPDQARRLTLEEVRSHPWITVADLPPPPQPAVSGAAAFSLVPIRWDGPSSPVMATNSSSSSSSSSSSAASCSSTPSSGAIDSHRRQYPKRHQHQANTQPTTTVSSSSSSSSSGHVVYPTIATATAPPNPIPSSSKSTKTCVPDGACSRPAPPAAAPNALGYSMAINLDSDDYYYHN